MKKSFKVLIVIGIALLTALPILPQARATTILPSYQHIYSGSLANSCLQAKQSSSGVHHGTDYQLLIFDVGSYVTNAYTEASSCTGYASLSAFAGISGGFPVSVSTRDATANVTFIDTVTVPNNGQQFSTLDFTGQYSLYGWQGAFASGSLSQAKSSATLSIVDRFCCKSDGSLINPGWEETPTLTQGVNYNPSCQGALIQWPPAPFFCDVTPQSITAQGQPVQSSFSHTTEALSPGTYTLILSFLANAKAEMEGPSFQAQASNCFEYDSDCSSVIYGSPPSPISCPSGLTGSNNQCYYIEWLSTKYTETDYFPSDPSYALASSQSLINVTSSGGANGGAQQTVQDTITVSPVNNYVTPSSPGCTYVSAYSYYGFTKHYFVDPQTGNYIPDACLTFTGTGNSISFKMVLWIPFCTSYEDFILIYSTDFVSETAGLIIPVIVNNACSLNTSVGASTVSTTGATSASTTFSVTNVGGPNYTCCITDYVGYVNYTDTSGNSVTCTPNVNCPSASFTNPYSGNPITYTLNTGSTLTANLVTQALTATPPENYLLLAVSGIDVIDNSTMATAQSPVFEECTPSQCYYAGGTWNNFIIEGQFVKVQVTADFSVSVNPGSVSIQQGNFASPAISIASLSGFSGFVILNYTSTVNGIYMAVMPENLNIASGATVKTSPTIGVPCNVPTGTYPNALTVTGQSGSLLHSVTISITVTSYACYGGGGGGGGGSVAAGTLITLADGSQVPVQNVRVGDSVIVYNVPTGYQTTATVTQIVTHTVNDTLTIQTSAGGTPFRADANPAMKLWVFTRDGPVEMPITLIQPGDQIYNYDLGHWVTVTDVTITYGGHHTVYDLITNPDFSNGLILEYIANGYPDCPIQCKT